MNTDLGVYGVFYLQISKSFTTFVKKLHTHLVILSYRLI